MASKMTRENPTPVNEWGSIVSLHTLLSINSVLSSREQSTNLRARWRVEILGKDILLPAEVLFKPLASKSLLKDSSRLTLEGLRLKVR